MWVILIIVLFLLMVGSGPWWPYSSGWGMGYYPVGGIGVVLLIVIILVLFWR